MGYCLESKQAKDKAAGLCGSISQKRILLFLPAGRGDSETKLSRPALSKITGNFQARAGVQVNGQLHWSRLAIGAIMLSTDRVSAGYQNDVP